MLIPSSTSPDKIYKITVALPGDPREEWSCTCPSWTYRGRCKHTAMVSPCHWEKSIGPETQTEEQARNYICPRCLGETFEDLIMQ